MAGKNEGGDKTEKPTRKRLRQAREKGDVAKSKDVGPALVMVAWVVLFVVSSAFIGTRIAAFADESLAIAMSGNFAAAAGRLGSGGFHLLLLCAAVTLVPAAVIGLAAEFMQVGVVLTGEKMKPSLDKLNPIEGLKRMFNVDNLVELIKTVIKAAVVLTIAGLLIWKSLPAMGELILAHGSGQQIAGAALTLTHSLTMELAAWTAGMFVLVAAADAFWSKHRFIRDLRMSRRDIRQEHKDSEGDPMLRGQRRQLHQEWANQNAIGSASKANLLLVNPTHLAIALDYDPDDAPIPVIAAKGEGPLAAAMRAAAEEAGVPIVRNVGLARAVWGQGAVGDFVPEDHFEAIAEIILWARRARTGDAAMLREDA